MNRERRLIRRNAAPRNPWVLAIALLCAAGGLSGCISDPFNQPTDKSAPGAALISQVAATPGPYPRWSKFPPVPRNVPTPAEFAAQAGEINQDRTQLLASANSIEWTLSGTEAWANDQRSLVSPTMAVPAPTDATAQAEAFAAAARKMATPPPPVK
jgi:hypothetical protein